MRVRDALPLLLVSSLAAAAALTTPAAANPTPRRRTSAAALLPLCDGEREPAGQGHPPKSDHLAARFHFDPLPSLGSVPDGGDGDDNDGFGGRLGLSAPLPGPLSTAGRRPGGARPAPAISVGKPQHDARAGGASPAKVDGKGRPLCRAADEPLFGWDTYSPNAWSENSPWPLKKKRSSSRKSAAKHITGGGALNSGKFIVKTTEHLGTDRDRDTITGSRAGSLLPPSTFAWTPDANGGGGQQWPRRASPRDTAHKLHVGGGGTGMPADVATTAKFGWMRPTFGAPPVRGGGWPTNQMTGPIRVAPDHR